MEFFFLPPVVFLDPCLIGTANLFSVDMIGLPGDQGDSTVSKCDVIGVPDSMVSHQKTVILFHCPENLDLTLS
jgi:hypothetical protein